jgi:hypothetical protein
MAEAARNTNGEYARQSRYLAGGGTVVSALMERRTIPGKEVTEIVLSGFNERLYSLYPEMREGELALVERLKANKPKKDRGVHQKVILPPPSDPEATG